MMNDGIAVGRGTRLRARNGLAEDPWMSETDVIECDCKQTQLDDDFDFGLLRSTPPYPFLMT
jgi:hypothetical protein